MKHDSPAAKIIIGCLAIISAAYLGMQIFKLVTDPVKIAHASYASVDQTIQTNGCFLRNERYVVGKSGGTAVFKIQNGQKVSKGETIAVYYKNSDAAEANKQIEELQKRMKDYEYVIAQAEDKPDTEKSNDEIIDMCVKTQKMLKGGHADKAAEQIDSLKSAVVRRSLVYGDLNIAEQKLKSLRSEVKALQSAFKNAYSSVNSACSGYFTQLTDGYEGVLSEGLIDSMTSESFESLKNSANDIPQNCIGKISENFYWYFAVCLDESQTVQLEKFSGTLKLRLSQILSSDIPVDIYSIRKETGGKTIVIFRGNRDDAALFSARYQPVEIVLKTYDGIKIPKEALRQVDGEWGIYCMSGRLSVFKKIKSIYEADNYVLIESSGEKSSEVFIYDEIIISGKGITDKQVIG